MVGAVSADEEDSAVVAVALEAIGVSVEAVLAAPEAIEATEVVGVELATSPTATVLLMVLHPVLVVRMVVVAEAAAVVLGMTGLALVTGDQAVPTTSRWAAEIVLVIATVTATATAIVMVGMEAETTMARASVGMTATATTIPDLSDAGTKSLRWLGASFGFVQRLPSLHSPCSSNLLVTEGKISSFTHGNTASSSNIWRG